MIEKITKHPVVVFIVVLLLLGLWGNSQTKSPEPKPLDELLDLPEQECPYSGEWNILLMYTMDNPPKLSRSSGTASVSKEMMIIQGIPLFESMGSISGFFSQLTDEGNWMYTKDEQLYIGIGEDTEYRNTSIIVSALDKTTNERLSVGFIVERADETVPGSSEFVGKWVGENDVTVEFTPGGVMIGEDSDGLWVNKYTVSGDTLQLVNIPDKFTIEGDGLRYTVNDTEIVFNRIKQ